MDVVKSLLQRGAPLELENRWGGTVLNSAWHFALYQAGSAMESTDLVSDAVRQLARGALGKSVLYTSCEPCAMCVGAMYWAGIRSVVYALPSDELAKLAGSDFLVPCREVFSRAS